MPPTLTASPSLSTDVSSYYLLFNGVKLFYSTVFGLKTDLFEQQVGRSARDGMWVYACMPRGRTRPAPC